MTISQIVVHIEPSYLCLHPCFGGQSIYWNSFLMTRNMPNVKWRPFWKMAAIQNYIWPAIIYLKETRVRTTHAARKMLLCRLEAAKRHLNPGKIFALARISPRSIRSVCVFSPLTWLVIIDNSLCVCACVCVCFSLGLGWLLFTVAYVCVYWPRLVIMCVCVCVCVCFVLALASLVIVWAVCYWGYFMCLPHW